MCDFLPCLDLIIVGLVFTAIKAGIMPELKFITSVKQVLNISSKCLYFKYKPYYVTIIQIVSPRRFE